MRTFVILVVMFLMSLVQAATSTADIVQMCSLDELRAVMRDTSATRAQRYIAVARMETLGRQNAAFFEELGVAYKDNIFTLNGMQVMTEEERIRRMKLCFLAAAPGSVHANRVLADQYLSENRPLEASLYLLQAMKLGDAGAKDALRAALSAPYVGEAEEIDFCSCGDVMFRKYAEMMCGIQEYDEDYKEDYALAQNDLGAYFDSIRQAATLVNPLESVQAADAATRHDLYQLRMHYHPAPPDLRKLWNFAKKLSLLALLGIILALIPSTHIHLFENGIDIIITLIVSIVFAYFLIWHDQYRPIPLTTRIIGMVVCALLLVPYSLKANGGKIWTLIVVVPGKIVLSALTILCMLLTIAYIFATIRSKKDRGQNLLFAFLWGGATFGLGKIIRLTTREKYE